MQRGNAPTLNEYPGYGTKKSVGETPGTLQFLVVLNTPSLPLLPGQLWPGVLLPDRFLCMGQIELS